MCAIRRISVTILSRNTVVIPFYNTARVANRDTAFGCIYILYITRLQIIIHIIQIHVTMTGVLWQFFFPRINKLKFRYGRDKIFG